MTTAADKRWRANLCRCQCWPHCQKWPHQYALTSTTNCATINMNMYVEYNWYSSNFPKPNRCCLLLKQIDTNLKFQFQHSSQHSTFHMHANFIWFNYHVLDCSHSLYTRSTTSHSLAWIQFTLYIIQSFSYSV